MSRTAAGGDRRQRREEDGTHVVLPGYWMRPKQLQLVSLAPQTAPVAVEQVPEQHGCVAEHDWPTYEHAWPMSVAGGVPQVPLVWPAGTLHFRPAQQSASAVQTPDGLEQAVPQRSTPVESGTQGAPLQHSDEKVHCWPAAMQQLGVPS